MNSIEERDNLIALMQEALKFYANKDNYMGVKNTCGPAYSMIDMDGGSQAQFALNKAKELADTNQKIQDDYDKHLMEVDSFEPEGETNPIDLIRVFSETRKDEDNLTKMRREGNENPYV
jgi:hypothetical protein